METIKRDFRGDIAYGRYRRKLESTKKSLNELRVALRVHPIERRKLDSVNIDDLIDITLYHGNHLRKTILSDKFNSVLHSKLQQCSTKDAWQFVKHIRNIREHWEDNRSAFDNLNFDTHQKSAKWYVAKRKELNLEGPKPNSPGPWEIVTRGQAEPYVAGIFRLSQLEDAIEEVENTFERHQITKYSPLFRRNITY